MKPYRVDFKYLTENTASLYICAANADVAAEGAQKMLDGDSQYQEIEIVSVEEYKPHQEQTPTMQ